MKVQLKYKLNEIFQLYIYTIDQFKFFLKLNEMRAMNHASIYEYFDLFADCL